MSKWYALHIKNEMLLWFFIVSIIPLVIISIINITDIKSTFELNTKKYLSEVLDKKVEITENYVDELKSSLETIASLPITKEIFLEYEDNFIENMLKKEHKKSDFFESLFLFKKISKFG